MYFGNIIVKSSDTRFKRHDSLKAAEEEALRLTQKEGQEFVIYAPVAVFRPASPPIIQARINHEGLECDAIVIPNKATS